MTILYRIRHFLFTPLSIDPADRYREQILRVIIPIFIILGSIANYLLYVSPPPLPAPLTREFIILAWYIPNIIAIVATYRGQIQIAILAFMINWFISNQRGVILDGYWDLGLRTALILELVFAAFMLRGSRRIILYAIAQMLSYTLLAINLEGRWYTAPDYFVDSSNLPSPYNVIITVIIFHTLFVIILRILKIEFDRRQKSLQHIIDTLEDRVSERTVALEEANQGLTELAQAKDIFVSNVSHELRTPISSILLTTGLLKRIHSDMNEPRFDMLIRDAKRLDNMIEALLLLSRLDQNRVTLQFDNLEIKPLVQTLVDDRVVLAEQQGITLTTNLSDNPIIVPGDFAMLEQVLSILITNAVNYTPHNGRVTVITKAMTSEEMQISVVDTGIGIEPEHLPKLFDRFFRGDTDIPGTGLGLAIAQEIVRQHQGQIDVESAGAGQGTTFIVTLPRFMT